LSHNSNNEHGPLLCFDSLTVAIGCYEPPLLLYSLDYRPDEAGYPMVERSHALAAVRALLMANRQHLVQVAAVEMAAAGVVGERALPEGSFALPQLEVNCFVAQLHLIRSWEEAEV